MLMFVCIWSILKFIHTADLFFQMIKCVLLINRESLQRGIEILCDPCFSGNVRSAATKFCKTCDDPEPLCDGCAQQHTRQKATKHHQMSNDLNQFFSFQIISETP